METTESLVTHIQQDNLPSLNEGEFTLVDSRDYQIISSDPIEVGVNSYGKGVGVVACIGIAVLFVLTPLLYCFFAIYDRVRSYSGEFQSIRENLAQSRLEALKGALIGYESGLDQKASLGECDKKTLREAGFSESVINGGMKEARFSIKTGKWKEYLKGSKSEVNAQIDALNDDIFIGLKEARQKIDDPWVQRYVALLALAQMSIELEDEASHLAQCREKVQMEVPEIEALSYEAKEVRQLDLFLLRKKVFGTDPSSERFQAGTALVAHQIGALRDQDFFSHVNVIIHAIENPSGGNLERHLQVKVREKLDRLRQSPLYSRLLKYEGRENALVRFVQDLSCTIRLESNGVEHVRALGHRYHERMLEGYGMAPEEYGFHDLADALDTSVGRYHLSYTIETTFDKFLVFARYPSKTQMAYQSHQSETALKYNSYRVGNHDMAYGDYRVGGRSMRAIYGPTPTSDLLLKAELDRLRERGGIHLQHNLEHPAFSKGDLTRIQYLLQVEEEYPETFRLLSTPLDGVGWRLRGEGGAYLTDFSSAEEFFLKYGTFAFNNRLENPVSSFDALEGDSHRKMEGRSDNGFYFGERVMSDEQIRLAFACVSQAFGDVNPELEDKKRLSRALQVSVQGFIAIGAMVQAIQDSPKSEEEILNAAFGQACKLDIDRGVVLNVMTRVYFHLAAGDPLDEETVSEIIGTVIGRAELVSGRAIITDRYQPLSDALRLMGRNPTQVQTCLREFLQQGLGVGPKELSFQSSS